MMTDASILALTMLGEARGEGPEGMRWVGHVCRNRMRDSRWPATVAEVCRQARQFSCWNSGDPNGHLMLHILYTPRYWKALSLALTVLGDDTDPTKGANHYHTYAVSPIWADKSKIVGELGHHIFYKL